MALNIKKLGKSIWEAITPQNEEALRRANASLAAANQRVASIQGGFGVLANPQARQQFIQQNQPVTFNLPRAAASAYADTWTKPQVWQQAPKVNVGSWKGSGIVEDFFNSPFKQGQGLAEIGSGQFKRGIGNVVAGTIEGPAGFIPIGKVAQAGKGAKLASRALSAAKVGAKEGAVYGGLYGGAQAAAQDASLGDIAKATGLGAAVGGAAGGVIGGGLPVAGAAAKNLPKALAKADEVAFTPRNMRIGPEVKGQLSDWADTKMGRYKPNAKERLALDQNARRLTKETGVDFVNGSPAEIDTRVAEFLDPTSVRQGGYIATSAKPKVGMKQPTANQLDVDPTDPFGNRNLWQRIKNEAGSLVDDDAQMLALLRRIEDQTGKQGLVDQWMFDTGNIRASNSIANAKLRNSENFSDAMRGLTKREADDFDKYVAARAELNNYEGLRTRNTPEANQATVAAGDAKFGARYQALNNFYKERARDLFDAGIISKETLDDWTANGDYVRIQRNMEDLVAPKFSGSKSRSFGTTTAKQRRTGSEREILSPTQTAARRTQQLQLEIQRNKAANHTIDLLLETGLARPVTKSTHKNTISRFVNGKKETFEVPGDIKEVIDNVNPYRLGVIARVISAPTRLFRAGTTALSAPFTVTNYLRDQASSALYSKDVVATHDPRNIVAGLRSAVKDFGSQSNDPLWKQFEEFAGDQTFYDELRNAKNSRRMLREVREGQAGKLKNMVTDPIRSLEDLNAITEKATRFQNFRGTYKKAIARGATEDAAIREAVLAARQNSVDFQRSSDFTRAVNLFIPYFNASVQGSRNVVRAFRDRPLGTVMKSVGMVATPSVALSAYNYSDENRRKVYESIDDFEKEDNFIIVGPNPKQNKNGSWEGVYKIPKPQGYRELTDPARDVADAFFGKQPIENVAAMFKDMLGGLSGPVDITDTKKLVGGLIPQQAKPWVQQGMNQDLYSGNKIVPEYMMEETDDPTKRAYEGTSGTARWIANQLNTSPLKVEKAINDISGSLGRYGINALDNALASQGAIPKEQIGGRSISRDFSRRLFEASGELLDENKTSGRRYFEDVAEVTKGLNKTDLAAFNSIHPSKTNFLGEQLGEKTIIDSGVKAGIYLQNPKVFEADKELDRRQRERGAPGNPLFDLSDRQRQVVLSLQANKAFNPGDKAMSKVIERQQPWLKDYNNKVSAFYDKLDELNKKEQGPSKANAPLGGATTQDKDPSGIPRPQISSTVSNKLEAAAQITDPALKAQFYKQNTDVTEYLAQNEEYNRAKRAYLGLPQLDRFPEDPRMKALEEQYFSMSDKTARKNFIKNNPALSDYWLEKNLWQLNEEGAQARYEGEELDESAAKDIMSIARSMSSGSGGRGFGFGGSGGGGGGGSDTALDPYKYALSLNAGGNIAKPKVSAKKASAPKSRKASKRAAPKVTMKKSRV